MTLDANTANLARHRPRAIPLSSPPPDPRLEAILESISDAFYAVDPDWTYSIFNAAAEAYFGIPRDQVLGRDMWDVFPQGVGTPFETILRRAMDERKGAQFESPSRWRPDRTVEVRVTPLVTGGIGVSLHDVTARKRAEEARELLIREVDHRSRNILAVVQAIVKMTEGPDLDSYKEAVFGRINALARAQGALAGQRWENAPMRGLLEEAMFALAPPERYDLDGPDIALRPDEAQPVSMIIHELATNASKYGALSAGGGRVEIRWSVEGGARSLCWRERGGPPTTPPAAAGFGSRLIRQLARQMAAEILLDWRPEGLSATLTLPTA
ncbi:MAG: PAS domain-containing protein [Caulobacter sp.]|nr:PAS domain-containing protein [Caulobacter sp.]